MKRKIIEKGKLDEIIDKEFNFISGDKPMNTSSEIKAGKTTDEISSMVNQNYYKYNPYLHQFFFFENVIKKGEVIDSMNLDKEISEPIIPKLEAFVNAVSENTDDEYEKYLILKELTTNIRIEDSVLKERIIKNIKSNNENKIIKEK